MRLEQMVVVMAIDPVVVLVKEIRSTETNLHAECKQNSAAYSATRAESINVMLAKIRALYLELFVTVPVSAPGAAELTRIVAERLPFSHARYAGHLNRIADRLAAGQRLHTDLVWLRALSDALSAGKQDGQNDKTVTLLTLAIRGAAQPVVAYRAAAPLQNRPRDPHALSRGVPFRPAPFAPATPPPEHF
jgi:hypothetical protein